MRLRLILGDQLDLHSAIVQGVDPETETVVMAELTAESTHVPSHLTRTVFFLSAMRHHRLALESIGVPVRYIDLRASAHLRIHDFEALVHHLCKDGDVEELLVMEPGEHRVLEQLSAACAASSVRLQTLPDTRFLCSTEEFRKWASNRKVLVLEHFYRHMRKRTGILMKDGEPVGGRWNFDEDNRQRFGRTGPPERKPPASFPPDGITRQVRMDVRAILGDLPGSARDFDWPVTREDAEAALEHFATYHLPDFGRWQDAMWTGEPFLWHSRLSPLLNVGLLNPRNVIERAEQALTIGHADIASVEGFVRQILGWREYVRGIYRSEGPDFLERNALHAEEPLPAFYWTGRTSMACLQEVIGQTLRFGYAHHIQRLMVAGLFSLLLGVRPREIHEWFLGIYIDAVEWVEAPNVMGMSQFADGGLLATKPYVATGKYIQRMSNYCDGCRFDPGKRSGPDACPFTVLYWDFLMRHHRRLSDNRRMALQLRNLDRLDANECAAIRAEADEIRTRLAAGEDLDNA